MPTLAASPFSSVAPPARPSWRALAGLTLAVGLVHVLLLGLAPTAIGPNPSPLANKFTTRTIVIAPPAPEKPAAPAAAAAAPAEAKPPPPAKPRRPREPSRPKPATATPEPMPVPADPAELRQEMANWWPVAKRQQST